MTHVLYVGGTGEISPDLVVAQEAGTVQIPTKSSREKSRARPSGSPSEHANGLLQHLEIP
jgi:hypothetical protein